MKHLGLGDKIPYITFYVNHRQYCFQIHTEAMQVLGVEWWDDKKSKFGMLGTLYTSSLKSWCVRNNLDFNVIMTSTEKAVVRLRSLYIAMCREVTRCCFAYDEFFNEYCNEIRRMPKQLHKDNKLRPSSAK